jgi:hypothetical protein
MTVWERRDLPVLQALATADPDLRRGFLEIDQTGENPSSLNLDGGDLHDAILTLRDAGYVEADLSYAGGPTAHFVALYVTGRGLQALGEWPLSTRSLLRTRSHYCSTDSLKRRPGKRPTTSDGLHGMFAASVLPPCVRSQRRTRARREDRPRPRIAGP